MLKEYIFGLLDHQKFVHVFEVRQSDLLRVEKVCLVEMKQAFRYTFDHDDQVSYETIKSFGNLNK